MTHYRLHVKIYKWQRRLGVEGWTKQVEHTLNYSNMLKCGELNKQCDLDVLAMRLKVLARQKWWLEAATKSKLDTFHEVCGKSEPQALVLSNLSHSHRSITARLEYGVLPLMVETSRFKGTGRELRVCPICDSLEREDEIHFTESCAALQILRKDLVKDLTRTGPETAGEKLDLLKSLLKDKLKVSSRHLDIMFEERKRLLASGIVLSATEDNPDT